MIPLCSPHYARDIISYCSYPRYVLLLAVCSYGQPVSNGAVIGGRRAGHWGLRLDTIGVHGAITAGFIDLDYIVAIHGLVL